MKKDNLLIHNVKNYPKELYKKFTLLQHFKNYLEGEGESYSQESSEDANPNYVKKWLRTKRAILFRFANKTVQVSFQDQTEVIISHQSKLLTYVNKSRARVTLPMNSALEDAEPEMAKRIKYTRDILNYMMNGKSEKILL